MGIKWAGLTVWFLAAVFLSAAAASQTMMTGEAWLSLPPAKQVEAVEEALASLKRSGVPAAKTPVQYAETVTRAFDRRPDYLRTDLESILASVLYASEEPAREAIRSSLDKLKR